MTCSEFRAMTGPERSADLSMTEMIAGKRHVESCVDCWDYVQEVLAKTSRAELADKSTVDALQAALAAHENMDPEV